MEDGGAYAEECEAELGEQEEDWGDDDQDVDSDEELRPRALHCEGEPDFAAARIFKATLFLFVCLILLHL